MSSGGQESGDVGMPGGTASARQGGSPESDLSGFDRAINDLHSRIADLRISVDDMGHGAPAPPPPPTYPPPEPQPASAYPPPPPPQAPPPEAYPPPPETGYPPPAGAEYPPPEASYPPPDPYQAPPPVGYPPPAYADPAAPSAYADPMAQPAAFDPYGPPAAGPVPPPEGSDALGTFFRVDVGPFEDLLAMTAFEEQLSALPSMADVRVRRFSAGRAEVELEMLGVAPLAREVLRVAPEAETVVQPDGTLTVELHGERWVDEADLGATGEEPEPSTGQAAGEGGPGEVAPEQGAERG